MSSTLPYAELDCLSNFSFLKGASHPEELVARAAALGYKALALADECSLAGVVRAHVAARQHALHLIVGSRFNTTVPGLDLIVLAQNLDGYGDLAQLITSLRTQAGATKKGPPPLHIPATANPQAPKACPNALQLAGCLVIAKAHQHTPAIATALQTLKQHYPGRLWLGQARHYQPNDTVPLQASLTLAEQLGLPVVALGQVEMHVRSRQPLHDTLAAIRLGTPIEQCGYALHPNAEHHMRSRFRLSNLFSPQILHETLNIAAQCTFSLDELRYQYPHDIAPPGMGLAQYLAQETWAGANRRYPGGIPGNVQAQINTELNLISQLHYEPYFLTVYDIVSYARSRHILCQGRGSAANSAVCYCLGITEVDPAQGNALFARFISAERNEPPDIDVDFEHQRREEVIQYIYDKYGRDRAALTAVVITYRRRSALRDTGKALSINPSIIDQVCKSCQYQEASQSLLEKLQEQGLDTTDHRIRAWAALAHTLLGFPRHLSQHPGGFVISQGPLNRLVPIENAGMPGRSVIQWDKDDLDAMGLLKVDVLALGMLSALKRALDLLSLKYQRPFALQDIPHEDPATYAMISRADTIGVFQIESRAQMSMLPRLRPRTFYDLVIQIAIVRPGPIQGDMVHPYLRRRQGLEPVSYPSPQVEHVLSRTLGVPIFQEQVMQIAMVAAGFSAGEADQLRRSMAAWKRKGGVDRFRPRLVSGMLARGYPAKFTELIYKQLEGFGEYGFPESHSASFANLAYASAWIKCHEPAAFLAALLNAQPLGFYAPSQLVQDATRHGVQVLPVDINESDVDAHLPLNAPGQTVRLGLNSIKGLPTEAAARIARARQHGPFGSIADLTRRADLNKRDLDALAGADAMSSLGTHRHQARWQAALRPSKDLLHQAPIHETQTPVLCEPTETQNIYQDYAATGLTLRRHPLALLRDQLQQLRFASAQQLHGTYPNRRLARACGLVTTRQRPQTAKGVIFVSLEDETGLVNVIVRPELARQQKQILVGSTLLGVYGVWQRHDNVCHLVAGRLVNLDHLLGHLPVRSRNFQ